MDIEEPAQKWRQFLISFSANLASATAGVSITWSSPSLVILSDPHNTPLDQPINPNESGWITSLMSLGAVFGAIVVFKLIDLIGRKLSLFISCAAFTIATILLISFYKLWAIYIARFLQGLTVGIVMTTEPIYNAEIATDDLRGALGAMMQFLMLIGLLFMQNIGSVVNYAVLQWIGLPFCILFPATFIYMPDTPHYYIRKQNYESAINSLIFLRGQSKLGVQKEYERIKDSVEKSLKNQGKIRDLLKDRTNREALKMCGLIILIQQLAGASVLVFNIEEIIISTRTLQPVTFLLIMSLVQIIANILSIILVDKMGRRVVIIISSMTMGLSLVGLGTYFYIQKHSIMTNSMPWIPLCCILLYIALFAFGYGTVPWIYVGETFSSSIKSVASAIIVCICWITSFVMSKIFPLMVASFGLDIVCWTYAIFTALGFIYICLCVIETKGLSLAEIQIKLSGKVNVIE